MASCPPTPTPSPSMKNCSGSYLQYTSPDKPVYGWAMSFAPPTYQPLPQDCATPRQRDGIDSRDPPFYHLGYQPRTICPYYNYTLPNVYPTDPDTSYPNPLMYWYYPYYGNKNFWSNPTVRVPKPG